MRGIATSGNRHKRHLGPVFLLSVLAIVVAGCDGPSSSGKADIFGPWSKEKPGRLLTEKCAFAVPDFLEARCYRLVVAQDRAKPRGPHLTIAAARIQKAGAEVSVDPVVYLEGGPGGASIPDRIGEEGEGERSWTDFSPVFDSGRALILVDGRGIGQSKPHLVCPRATELAWKLYQKRPAERDEGAYLRQIDACLSRFTAGSVDFSLFNSATTAQDLMDLRRALGVEKWNLFGVSYGARTALELAKLDPEGVRSVVYDSPSYQRDNVWEEDQAAFNRMLSVLQYGCRSGELCSPAREDILTVLERNLNKVDGDPPKVSLNFYSSPVFFDSDLALYALHLMLYYDDGASLFAEAVDALGDGDKGWLRPMLELVRFEYDLSGFSDVVNWSTYCREQYLDGDYDQSARFAIYNVETIRSTKHVCEKMGVAYEGAPFDARAVAPLPSLVVSGGRDPITPPAYGARLAKDVSAAGYVVVAKAAHGVMFDHGRPCVQEIMTGFLVDPDTAPADACANGQ